MFAVLVAEVIINTLFLHQATDKIEIRFAVLDAVIPRVVGLGQLIIDIAAETSVAELKDGEITEYRVQPEDFSLNRASLDVLKVDNSEDSLALVKAALDGSVEAASDIVAMNAGAAIYVSGQALSLAGGVEMAKDAIGAGLASEKMKDFVNFTQQISDDEE